MVHVDILRHRLYNEQLTQKKFKKPQDIVGWFGAIQSQDYSGAKWAIGQRLQHATDDSIEQAFTNGDIIRTHVMRPTWHFVLPQDIRWMLMLTAPQIARVMASYNKKLELDQELFKKAQATIINSLKERKQLTRQELKIELSNIGIETDVQRLAHIVMQAELDAVICSGPRRGKQFTYMLLDERVPKTKSLTREEALEQLAKRYFQSHGPATLKDFAWWSGLTIADVKNGISMIKSKLARDTVEGIDYWFFPSDPNSISDSVYLLPNYDEFAIAYKERSAFFNPEYAKLLDSRGNSVFQHIIVFEGRIIGLWKRTFKKDSIFIEAQFFTKPTTLEYNAFKEATNRFGRFLNVSVNLEIK